MRYGFLKAAGEQIQTRIHVNNVSKHLNSIALGAYLKTKSLLISL